MKLSFWGSYHAWISGLPGESGGQFRCMSLDILLDYTRYKVCCRLQKCPALQHFQATYFQQQTWYRNHNLAERQILPLSWRLCIIQLQNLSTAMHFNHAPVTLCSRICHCMTIASSLVSWKGAWGNISWRLVVLGQPALEVLVHHHPLQNTQTLPKLERVGYACTYNTSIEKQSLTSSSTLPLHLILTWCILTIDNSLLL